MKWPYRKIAEFCTTGSGGTPSRQKAVLYYRGDIPWVKSGELKDSILFKTDETITKKGLEESSAKLVPAGSILIAMYGATVGKTALLGINASTNQAICNIQPNPEIVENKFLWHFLKSNIKELLYKRVGGAQPNISQQIIKETKAPIPPISEQRRIVEILDQADHLRKLRANADAKAQRILPALFIKMFGDPIANPMGWPLKKMRDLSVDLRYGTSTKCSSNEIGLPVLRIPNVVSGRINLNDLKFVELSKNEIDNLLMEQGDILFVRTNGNRDYVGRCSVFDLDGNYLYASYLIRARLYKEKVDSKFVGIYLSTPTGRQAMAPFIRTTAGQSNISQEGLKQIPIPLPPIEKQKKFCRMVEEIRNLNKLQFIGFEKFDFLFAVLLHRAFTGDLTASWREAHMKEVLQEMEVQAKALAS